MEIQYNIVNQISDLTCLKDKWQKLEQGEDMTVFQTFEWNVLLCEQWLTYSFNTLFSKIYIVELISEGKTKIIAPLIVQKHSVGIKWLGRKKGIYFLGIESYSDYMNFVYDNVNEEMLDFLVKDIHRSFHNLPFYMDYIRDNTVVSMWCDKQSLSDRVTTSAYVNLQEEVEAYTKSLSKSTRQNLRTALNRMEKDNYKYELLICSNVDNDDFIDNLDSIHTARTKKKNKVKDIDLLHYCSRYLHAEYTEIKAKKYNIISNSMKRMTNSVVVIVKMNNDVVGYLYGLSDNKAVRIMQNCFKEEYSFYSPLFRGAYDFLLSSIINKQFKQVDFTRGDEQYKFKLGCVEMALHHYIYR